MATFKDGSSISDNTFAGETAVDVYRLITLKSMLNLEMKTSMRMSRHITALAAAENMAGQKFGRGVSGRAKALAWVMAELARINDEERVD
jgi:hypothetical protein